MGHNPNVWSSGQRRIYMRSETYIRGDVYVYTWGLRRIYIKAITYIKAETNGRNATVFLRLLTFFGLKFGSFDELYYLCGIF